MPRLRAGHWVPACAGSAGTIRALSETRSADLIRGHAEGMNAVHVPNGYLVNVLSVAHDLLKANGEMTTKQLHESLLAKNWKILSLSSLAEGLASRPKWFTLSGADAWLATSEDVSAAVRLDGLRFRALHAAGALDGLTAYVSGGGEVWHADLDCVGLWSGKAKAAAEGQPLREIDVKPRRIATGDRPACSVCVTEESW